MRHLALLAILLTTAQAAAAPPCRLEEPDTIYHNGVVETLDKFFSRGQAIATRDGLVIAAGSETSILALRGCRTRVVDLGGLTVLPGFVDAHTHAFASTTWGLHPPPADSKALELLRQVQRAQLRVGITTQAEALSTADLVHRLDLLASAGELYIRTSVYLRRTGNCRDLYDDADGFSPITSLLASPRLPGIKIFADGALNNPCGYQAATTWDQDPSDDRDTGDLLFKQSMMDTLVREADAEGWQILVHSIGDRSRDEILESYSKILPGGGVNSRRHRIEHNNWIRPDQIAKYVEYGIIPVVFGYQFTCWINAGDDSILNAAPDLGWYQPYRTMLAAGLRLAWHGDWTAADIIGSAETPELWMGGILSSLVTRKEFVDGSVCEPQPFAAAETVTIQQALRMVTRGSAYAIGMENVIGSLEPGKLADMAIVSGDPMTMDADSLHEMRVVATIIGDVMRSCAAGQPLCR